MAHEETPLESEEVVDEVEDLATDAAVAEELSHEPVQGDGAEPASVESASAEAIAPVASAELRAVVEALIFASPEPITPKTLYKLLSGESKEAVSAAVNELRADRDVKRDTLAQARLELAERILHEIRRAQVPNA